MILDLIAIFKARKNPRQATKLAARFAQGQAIDRLATPIILAQCVLWTVAALMLLLVGLAVFGAGTLHGSILFVGLLPAIIGAIASYIAVGIGRGLDRIKEAIASLSNKCVDHLASRRQGPARSIEANGAEDATPSP